MPAQLQEAHGVVQGRVHPAEEHARMRSVTLALKQAREDRRALRRRG